MKSYSEVVSGQANVLFAHSYYTQRLEGPPELLPRNVASDVTSYDSALGLKLAPMTSLIWCLSMLAAQYFAFCGILAVVRLYEQLPARERERRSPSVLLRTLEAAELTLRLAPALCTLFLAAQMQAMQHSHGREDPPQWVKMCMRVGTGALLVQTALALVARAVTGITPEIDEDAILVDVGSKWVWTASFLATGTLLGACGGICVGILSMRAPEELIPGGGGISPSVQCTVSLTLQYFGVHSLLAIVARAGVGSKAHRVLKLAANTVALAPMMCILFIAARIRAMQVDRRHDGAPQPWAQLAFHVCTWALFLQTLIVIIVPFLPGGDARRGTSLLKGDVEILHVACEYGPARLVFVFARYTPCFFLVGGVASVIASLVLLHSPTSTTPPLPPTILCVICLVAQFFLINLGMWAAIGIRDFTRGLRFRIRVLMKVVAETLYSASATVQLCPMLAVLFVSLRLRAQQLTGHTGAPQGWAQDAMYVCTGIILAQLFICLLAGLSLGRAPDVHDDGRLHVSEEAVHPAARKALVGAQILLSVAFYSGTIVVTFALFTLTPKEAGGHPLLAALSQA